MSTHQPMKITILFIAVLSTLCLCADASTVTTSQTFVPLIGISSVPDPIALPKGPGEVTFHYAVKNFLKEAPLRNVSVVDDHCSSVTFIGGDDNKNGILDNEETWRYSCTTTLSQTTKSVATASAFSGELRAVHNAYTTVVVGSDVVPPLVGIINITKVAYPVFLPAEGGDITFTYRVNNPGVLPLSRVKVSDDKCPLMSGRLGDTNGNDLLDGNEVWIYHCKAHLDKTTTNTVSVSAYTGTMRAVGSASITVTVEPLIPVTSFLTTMKALFARTGSVLPMTLLIGLSLLLFLVSFYAKTSAERRRFALRVLLLLLFTGGVVGSVYDLFFVQVAKTGNVVADDLFGWKFPITKFPITGPVEQSYSAIREPGGIPSGLPVRLKIPIIGVDSAVEDALITRDGRMDVPEGSIDVAWFALGPHPGQIGSAVIGGHFGIRDGEKFVFYDLDKLKEGDKLFVEDDKNDTHEFIVRSVALFDRNGDATTVFSSSDGVAHLNLITCEGVWNQVNGGYPKRRVVFADALQQGGLPTPGGSVDLQKENALVLGKNAFQRNLHEGESGIDVVALQSALEQKNMLLMPAGVAKGYFGSLTRLAVYAYQKSVGATPTGIFDAQTRVMLVAENPTLEPKFPIAGIPGFNGAPPLSFTSIGNPFDATGKAFSKFLEGIFPFSNMIKILILLLSILGLVMVSISFRRGEPPRKPTSLDHKP